MSGTPYEPELGQAIFGNRWQEYECPEWFEALLRDVGSEIERVEWNRTQEGGGDPTGNTGAEFVTESFQMRAYWWGDCICDEEGESVLPRVCRACLPNFKCGDIEVSWYKYLGRGTTINRPISYEEGIAAFEKCLNAVRAYEREAPND